MLNWIAIWVGKWLLEALDGLLQGAEPSLPRSDDILDSAKLRRSGAALQPLHAGIFIALFALVVYHLLLNRTTLGYEVRAVGFNPEAAAYGGISVKRNYFLALAIAGAFAGLAGAIDMVGWKYRLDEHGVRRQLLRLHRHRRRAARTEQGARHPLRRAPLRLAPGRDVAAPARSRGLQPRAGDEPRHDDPGADHRLRRRRVPDPLPLARATAGRLRRPTAPSRSERMSTVDETRETTADRLRRLGEPRSLAITGICLGALALWLSLPPFTLRNLAVPAAVAVLGAALGLWALTRGQRKLGIWAILVPLLASWARSGSRARTPPSWSRSSASACWRRLSASRRRLPSPRWAASSPSAPAS